MERVGALGSPDADPDSGENHANELYERVLGAYGDDSVAQLGSAHIACESVSNVLTKILERGRLMSYLEQSTRYIPYNGRWTGGGATACLPRSPGCSPRVTRTRWTSAS